MRWRRRLAGLALACAPLATSQAQEEPAGPAIVEPAQTPPPPAPPPPAGPRNGREIYQRFREGLADPDCSAEDTSPRWRKHFANAPKRLATRNDDVLPLFGYVVETLREAHLPTELALIPFVESGYRPDARSASGPVGMWQLIALTARAQGVPIGAGYDGRLSPVDSTEAAVRYLKTLYGMFAGDWRLAAMAYNAGEYRVIGALKRSGQVARDAQPDRLVGLSPITHAYVRKLHALSCLMEQADDREEWLQALDRPVPRLEAVTVPEGVERIEQWATRSNADATQLQRLNPAFANGWIRSVGGRPARLLATADAGPDPVPAPASSAATAATDAGEDFSDAVAEATIETDAPRRHTVVRGESAWNIARRYGVRVADLLQRNGLRPGSLLKPGKVLLIDPVAAGTPTMPGE